MSPCSLTYTNSYKGTVGKVAQNRINRRFNTHIPYHKITTDTTEFKYYTKDQNGKTVIEKAYLDPFLDMFNGEILSYKLSQTSNAKAILDALDETIMIAEKCPYRTTIHTDQGWGYRMKVFRKRLKDNKVFQSMSRRGNCLDNSPMENFFGLMKQFDELKQAVDKYIYYYNSKRLKAKLTGMSPIEYRKQASQLVA